GEAYLTLGTFTPGAPRTSDYAGRDIYYRSVQRRSEDWLTVRDFLWRWDTDWFWCSRAFGAQHPLVRPLWPRRYKRSDVYWRLVALEQRYGVVRRIDALRGRPRRESVVQDVEVPVEALPACLEGIERITGIRPVWVCPLQLRDGAGWPLYPLDPGRLYVNVGFWSTVALPAGADDGSINRSVEALVAALGGHKSLYSTVHYSPEEFWARYPAAAYAPAKARYDPDGRFPDLYAKTVGRA
ncbi:MAG TPA: FAD-binding protein, partial [Mycobacteriales bacterium]|nr:FAD-binding protein [Mycobacteriales bacterium]